MWRGRLRIPCRVASSAKSRAGACPFRWQEGTSAGSQVREGGATGLRCAGIAVEVFGIGLISYGSLLDDGETGDTVE